MGDQYGTNGDTTLGKVRPMGGAGAWGGYTGTVVSDGKGGTRYDANLSGRGEAVGRARGLAEAAANRDAYQLDYTDADSMAGLGRQDRAAQVDAMGLARDTALGNNLQSQALGQQMIGQSVAAQQSAAGGARGGGLAQAMANRQQAGGQAQFVGNAQTTLDAQRAAEMAAGRDAYMQQATGIRAGDAQAQGLNQHQAIAQMGQELSQRGLNQTGQMGYEAQGQAINKAAADASLRVNELNHNIDSASSLRAQKQADRELQTGAAGAAAGGALLAKVGDSFGGGPTPPTPTPAPTPAAYGTPESDPTDPYKYNEAVSNSDVRGKTRVTSLAAAAVARKRMR